MIKATGIAMFSISYLFINALSFKIKMPLFLRKVLIFELRINFFLKSRPRFRNLLVKMWISEKVYTLHTNNVGVKYGFKILTS